MTKYQKDENSDYIHTHTHTHTYIYKQLGKVALKSVHIICDSPISTGGVNSFPLNIIWI